LASAPASLAEARAREARAQNLQTFLQQTPNGGAIPAAGLIDPFGLNIFPQNIAKTDTFSTGVRGALPTGLTYELAFDLTHSKMNASPDEFYTARARITVD